MTDNPETSQPGEHETSIEASSGAISAWDDLQVGFCGNPTTKLDERGRLKMPAEFKAFIEKKYGKDFNAFYIVSREGGDAEIYPMPEWQKQMANVFSMPTSDSVRAKLLESYSLYGGRAEMDPQGRLLFPEELRKEGFVNLEVKVSGDKTRLRVKSLASLRQSVKANPYTAQDLEVMQKYDV
jgi:MraZ protein